LTKRNRVNKNEEIERQIDQRDEEILREREKKDGVTNRDREIGRVIGRQKINMGDTDTNSSIQTK
jgi:hypothetical protein